MVVLSQEKINKSFYTYHATNQIYDHPIIDTNMSLQGGFGGDAYGKGFYTTTNPKAIDGYVSTENHYVRKQKIPTGTVYVDLSKFPKYLIEKFMKAKGLGNIAKEALNNILIESKESNTVNLLSIFINLKNENFNYFLYKNGIDAIKYPAFYNISPELHEKYKDYGDNWLIINPKIINKNKKPSDSSTYKLDRANLYNELLNSHPNKRKKIIDAIGSIYPSDVGGVDKIIDLLNKNIISPMDIADINILPNEQNFKYLLSKNIKPSRLNSSFFNSLNKDQLKKLLFNHSTVYRYLPIEVKEKLDNNFIKHLFLTTNNINYNNMPIELQEDWQCMAKEVSEGMGFYPNDVIQLIERAPQVLKNKNFVDTIFYNVDIYMPVIKYIIKNYPQFITKIDPGYILTFVRSAILENKTYYTKNDKILIYLYNKGIDILDLLKNYFPRTYGKIIKNRQEND